MIDRHSLLALNFYKSSPLPEVMGICAIALKK